MGAAGGGTEDELGLDMGAELAAGAQPLESVPPLESLPRPTCPLALPPPKFKVEPGTSLRPTKGLAGSSLASFVAPLPSLPVPSASTSTLPPPPVAEAEAEDPYAGLSARERNKLKRQRKNEAKGGEIGRAHV